ncbi:conserved hypothetical protein [uncultured Gammaproteobacteria bacterium]
MTTLDWPLDLRPVEQVFHVRTQTAQTPSALSGAGAVLGRRGEHWIAELILEPVQGRLPWLEALLAQHRGGAVEVLLPDFVRLAGHGSLASFDAYAAEIGATSFEDGTMFDDGTAFFEGAGTPVIAGGCGQRLVLTGCRPGAADVLLPGDLVQTSPGRGHLIAVTGTPDQDGMVVIEVAPALRSPPLPGTPVTAVCKILMRLTSGEALANPTTPFLRSRYRLSFVEAP